MYEIGYHSDEIECPHVALVIDGKRNEIFDVRLGFTGEMGDETNPAYLESKADLQKLLDTANSALTQTDLRFKGLHIRVYESEEDGASVVQIDTDDDETAFSTRVYMNDASALWE